MKARALVPLILVGSAGSAACRPAPHVDDTLPVWSDSAGVAVASLVNLPSLDDPRYRWGVTVARSIALDRGLDRPPLLYRPESMFRFDDGTIVVADRGDFRLVVFDPANDTVLRRFARSGAGPGEIDGGAYLWADTGRTISVYDGGTGRLSRFRLDGTLVSERLLILPLIREWQVRRQPAGIFTLRYRRSSESRQWLADSIGYVDLATDSIRALVPTWSPPPRTDGVAWGSVVFRPRVLWAPLGRAVVVGRSDQGSFDVYADDGALLTAIRLPLTPRPIGLEERAEILNTAASLPGASRPGMPERVLNSHFNVTNYYWAFDDTTLAMYQGRNTRAAEDPAIPEEQTVWRLVTVAGTYRGAVWFPPGFAPRWVGDDRVLGIATDSIGAEHLQELVLRPPGRGSR